MNDVKLDYEDMPDDRVVNSDILLRISFGKIIASKRERGGAKLHKSLMVLNVMRKAKQDIFARSGFDIFGQHEAAPLTPAAPEPPVPMEPVPADEGPPQLFAAVPSTLSCGQEVHLSTSATASDDPPSQTVTESSESSESDPEDSGAAVSEQHRQRIKRKRKHSVNSNGSGNESKRVNVQVEITVTHPTQLSAVESSGSQVPILVSQPDTRTQVAASALVALANSGGGGAAGPQMVELRAAAQQPSITVPMYNLINLLNCHFSQLLRQQDSKLGGGAAVPHQGPAIVYHQWAEGQEGARPVSLPPPLNCWPATQLTVTQ